MQMISQKDDGRQAATERQDGEPTPGQVGIPYLCTACAWAGIVKGRPRCPECNRRRAREWRAENPVAYRAQKKRWRSKKGPEYAAARKRTKRLNNPDTSRDAFARRTAWLRSGDVSANDLREIYARDGEACVYCRAKVKARFCPSDPRGFDHVTPRVAGGLHTKSNLVTCCGRCNAVKGGTFNG